MNQIGISTKNILLLKVGGSSVTEKGKLEALNVNALEWFSQTILSTINDDYLSTEDDERGVDNSSSSDKPAMIIVHGAGSFGHHTAKQYGLRGKTSPPPDGMFLTRRLLTGIAQTRHR